MFVADDFLKKLKTFRGRKEYQTLNGVSKTVVKYLMAEAEDLVLTDKIAYRKNSRLKTSKIRMFTLEFNYNCLHIWTHHRSGAARIYCINNFVKEDAVTVISILEVSCRLLGWNLESEIKRQESIEKTMVITYDA